MTVGSATTASMAHQTMTSVPSDDGEQGPAEVLPIHLNVFQTGDLADLPPSEYVPSPVFLQEDSATREDLSALALSTCKGHPFRSTRTHQGLCPLHTLAVRTASHLGSSSKKNTPPSHLQAWYVSPSFPAWQLLIEPRQTLSRHLEPF